MSTYRPNAIFGGPWDTSSSQHRDAKKGDKVEIQYSKRERVNGREWVSEWVTYPDGTGELEYCESVQRKYHVRLKGKSQVYTPTEPDEYTKRLRIVSRKKSDDSADKDEAERAADSLLEHTIAYQKAKEDAAALPGYEDQNDEGEDEDEDDSYSLGGLLSGVATAVGGALKYSLKTAATATIKAAAVAYDARQKAKAKADAQQKAAARAAGLAAAAASAAATPVGSAADDAAAAAEAARAAEAEAEAEAEEAAAAAAEAEAAEALLEKATAEAKNAAAVTIAVATAAKLKNEKETADKIRTPKKKDTGEYATSSNKNVCVDSVVDEKSFTDYLKTSIKRDEPGLAKRFFRFLKSNLTGSYQPEITFSPKHWVFRKVKHGDNTCMIRGVIARHGDDCVIFWIDADENRTLRTTHVDQKDSLEGWFKGWYDLGPPYIKATKPGKKRAPSGDGSAPDDGAEDDYEEEEEDAGPLNKQFTALFARLRDLEARLAPPQTPQITRDARPATDHLAELRGKIARTRSLIERDVAGLRRVHV